MGCNDANKPGESAIPRHIPGLLSKHPREGPHPRLPQKLDYQRKESLRKSKSKKGKATHKNIQKQRFKVARLYERITNIRIDYENKVISELVKAKPAYIALEDLNVSGMMKNRHLSKAISEQRLRFFRNKIKTKAAEYGIEIREVNRWYPSSKICHNCGYLKHNLTLKERIYVCPCCNYHADRDYNAALNIRDTNEYKLV